jgi:hypothetical protein
MSHVNKKPRSEDTDEELQEFIDATNEAYEKLHLDFENQCKFERYSCLQNTLQIHPTTVTVFTHSTHILIPPKN